MASHQESSIFPAGIDPRVYLQEVRLSQLNTKTAYEQKLDENSYSEASAILQTSGIDYYGAYILNLLENRLFNIQNYLLAKPKPDLVRHQSEEPDNNLHEGLCWVE